MSAPFHTIISCPAPYILLFPPFSRPPSSSSPKTDLEFSVEDRTLYMLQTRNGKRTAKASVQIACDMVAEGMINEHEALLRIDPERMNYFLHPTVDTKAEKMVLGKGLPASPGAATGTVVFSPEVAEAMVKADAKVQLILVRSETTADDIHGMRAACGILTENGGMTRYVGGRRGRKEGGREGGREGGVDKRTYEPFHLCGAR